MFRGAFLKQMKESKHFGQKPKAYVMVLLLSYGWTPSTPSVGGTSRCSPLNRSANHKKIPTDPRFRNFPHRIFSSRPAIRARYWSFGQQTLGHCCLLFTGKVADASGLPARQRAFLCASPWGGVSGNISSGVVQCACVSVCGCHGSHRWSSWRRAYARQDSHPLFALGSACVCACKWVSVQVRWGGLPSAAVKACATVQNGWYQINWHIYSHAATSVFTPLAQYVHDPMSPYLRHLRTAGITLSTKWTVN